VSTCSEVLRIPTPRLAVVPGVPKVAPAAAPPSEETPDAELVRRCASRDERAWTELVRRYRRLVYAVPVRAGLDEDTTEEIFQETFVRLSQGISRLHAPGRVRSWIVTTVRRLTIDAIRARVSARRLTEALARAGDTPDHPELPLAELERIERRDRVRLALSRLSPRDRRVLHRLFCEPEAAPDYRTVAHDLGMAVGSIGPTRARCLEKLRVEYERLTRED